MTKHYCISISLALLDVHVARFGSSVVMFFGKILNSREITKKIELSWVYCSSRKIKLRDSFMNQFFSARYLIFNFHWLNHDDESGSLKKKEIRFHFLMFVDLFKKRKHWISLMDMFNIFRRCPVDFVVVLLVGHQSNSKFVQKLAATRFSNFFLMYF